MNHLVVAVLLAALPLAGCQQTPATETPPAAGPPAPPATRARTEAEARATLAAYLRRQPEADRYVVDSARFVEVDALWQVLVPRTDWAGRMPNRAAFTVDKLTGEVRPLPVK